MLEGRGPVLCCADSNIAVDNLCEAVAAALGSGNSEAGAVVRLGRAETAAPSVQRFVVDMAAQGGAAGGGGGEAKRRLQAAQVVCCTSTGAGSAVLDKLLKAGGGGSKAGGGKAGRGRKGGGGGGGGGFRCVLVDEAAQATEPTTLIPLTNGCQQLVLVGDHHQLPPTVVSEEAGAHGLTESLFGRLAGASDRQTGRQIDRAGIQHLITLFVCLFAAARSAIMPFPARIVSSGSHHTLLLLLLAVPAQMPMGIK
eukprot:SAG22_NODE_1278_length_4905_cov_1.660216_3_plen_254_part_00